MTAHTQSEYDTDFYAWTMHNAELLRERKFEEIDINNIAEEIESMGRSNKYELINRLAVLMAHLLKWKFQPERRSKSWKCTIKEQRLKILRLLKESPSLKHRIEESMSDAYEQAIVTAAGETRLDEEVFPSICIFSLDDCLNHEFFPGD